MRETTLSMRGSRRRRPGHQAELLPVMPPARRLPAARKRAAPIDRDAGAPAPVRTGVHPPPEARSPPAGRPSCTGRRPWRTPPGPSRAAPGPERGPHPRGCLHQGLYITLVTYAKGVRSSSGHERRRPAPRRAIREPPVASYLAARYWHFEPREEFQTFVHGRVQGWVGRFANCPYFLSSH